MLSTYYSTSPDEGSETSLQSSCAAASIQPYWNNVGMNPWMTSDIHPSMLGNGMTSDGQYVATTASNGAWGQPIPTSGPDQAWASAYDYGSMNNHHDMQSSRDVSPNDDYFGTVDLSNGSSSWDTSSQPMYSPYSEVPPQIAGLGNSTSVAISPMDPPHHQAYSAAQIPAPTTTLALPPSHKPSSTTKASKSSKRKSQSPTTTSSAPKSKSASSNTNKRKASSSSSSKSSRDNSKYLPQEVHRIASEHISREAWRICKAEAIEMEQRRLQLLQNGSGELEREMLQQRHDLSMIRQGVLREQGVLEDALKRAERLGKA